MRQGSLGTARIGLLSIAVACSLFGTTAKSMAAPPQTSVATTPATPRTATLAAPATIATATVAERNAVVEIRIQNRKVSLGFVLEGDGRILTTLSPLGRAIGVTARYADGSIAKLRVLHADRGWDLALLTPDDQRWTHGVLASKVDPFQEGGALRIVRLDPRVGARTVALPMPHRENLTGGDAALLSQALTFGQALTASDLGAPIVDAGGSVVAMVAQACLPNVTDRCGAVYYAVPTFELRRFLREGLTAQNVPLPWLGLTVIPENAGPVTATRIQSVLPNSPASTLGLRAGKQGDLLLAVNSTPVGTPKDVAELLHRHRSGDRVTLLLLADGRYQEVRVTLGSYPEAARPSSGMPISQPDLGY